jgi:protease-4
MDSNEIPPIASPPPPPFNPPPPSIMAPMPPRPRKSRGWMIFAIVLLVALCISVLLNFGQFVTGLMPMKAARLGATESAAPKLDEVLLEDNDSSSKIAVIDVDGIITSRSVDQGGFNMVELIKEQLKLAKEDDRVKAVLLRVDSPGGEVLASDEIYRLLEKFQDESHKPVVTSMGNLAASGGYYISSASRFIVANEMTITGSIGVILHTWNYRGLMDKVGLRPEVFKSGKHKDMLSGEREPDEIPPDERDMIQNLIMQTYSRFTSVVQTGRDAAHDKNQNNSEDKRQSTRVGLEGLRRWPRAFRKGGAGLGICGQAGRF